MKYTLIFLLLFVACKKDNPVEPQQPKIFGTWANIAHGANTIVFTIDKQGTGGDSTFIISSGMIDHDYPAETGLAFFNDPRVHLGMSNRNVGSAGFAGVFTSNDTIVGYYTSAIGPGFNDSMIVVRQH